MTTFLTLIKIRHNRDNRKKLLEILYKIYLKIRSNTFLNINRHNDTYS